MNGNRFRSPFAAKAATQAAAGWKPGLPRGPITAEMTETYEVYFSPGGMKWHRRRTADEIAEYRRHHAET